MFFHPSKKNRRHNTLYSREKINYSRQKGWLNTLNAYNVLLFRVFSKSHECDTELGAVDTSARILLDFLNNAGSNGLHTSDHDLHISARIDMEKSKSLPLSPNSSRYVSTENYRSLYEIRTSIEHIFYLCLELHEKLNLSLQKDMYRSVSTIEFSIITDAIEILHNTRNLSLKMTKYRNLMYEFENQFEMLNERRVDFEEYYVHIKIMAILLKMKAENKRLSELISASFRKQKNGASKKNITRNIK